MAILQGSTLLNCLYIPDFIPSGSITAFENGNAPTSWTKVTSYNNYTLRIVNGSVSTLATNNFTTTLTSRSDTVSVTANTSGFLIGPGSAGNGLFVNTSPSSLPVSTFAAGLAGLPLHVHDYTSNSVNQRLRIGPYPQGQIFGADTTGSTGGNTQHSHSAVPTSQYNSAHNHSFPTTTHTHPASESQHPHSGSLSSDFRVYYRDIILASKD